MTQKLFSMDHLVCTRKITCPETSGNQPSSLVVLDALRLLGARFFKSNSTLSDPNFCVNFDGGDGGDGVNGNADRRNGDASDKGDGEKNGSGEWRRQQWRQKMRGAVVGWCCLASGSFSYLV